MNRLNRRTFLRHTALATGAVAMLAPQAHVLGANDDLRLAVLGFNSQGNTHLRALRELAGVRVVALCDCDRAVLDREVSAAKKRNETVAGYTDIRRLLENKDDDARQNFDAWELDALSGHIVGKHHRYVAEALPMLDELTAKVARVHGERHPELVEIALLFDAVAMELQMHMHKEERVLFPYITKMATAWRERKPMPIPVFGSVENPIRMMEAEHESAGDNLEEIPRLSDDYSPPVDACTSYRVLFAKLDEFERDRHQHVHLENNILFPKAIQLEKDNFAA